MVTDCYLVAVSTRLMDERLKAPKNMWPAMKRCCIEVCDQPDAGSVDTELGWLLDYVEEDRDAIVLVGCGSSPNKPTKGSKAEAISASMSWRDAI